MNVIAMISTAHTDMLGLQIRQIRSESVDVNSYELVDPAGGELPAVVAGSHIDVHLDDGLIRQYSLCSTLPIAGAT